MSAESSEHPVALVTGASGGLGAAVMRTLHQRGIKVVGLGRRADPAVDIWLADVTSEADVRAAVERVAEVFGRLDVLVNCAAVASSGDDLALTPDEWHRVLGVNLVGAYLCCRHAADVMRARQYGRIVNIASVAARSRSQTSSVAYTASKYGLIGLTRQLAARLGPHGITVNCVAPSQFETPMLQNVSPEVRGRLAADNPMGRLGTADEVAAVVAFLAADAPAYVNGAVIDVNGGLL